MADVFVSYAHGNKDRVTPIAQGLQNGGYSLWWDKSLNAGDDFALAIERELNAARCVVVAWSAQARESLWVRAEASEALDAGKLVQVRLDAAKPPLPFTAVQMIDFSRWRPNKDDGAWSQLRAVVGAIAGGGARALGADEGPALQGLESVAAAGSTALGLTMLVAVLTLLLEDGIVTLELYGAISAGAFVIATCSFLITLARAFTIRSASRRP